jgi:hypothetical protein
MPARISRLSIIRGPGRANYARQFIIAPRPIKVVTAESEHDNLANWNWELRSVLTFDTSMS